MEENANDYISKLQLNPHSIDAWEQYLRIATNGDHDILNSDILSILTFSVEKLEIFFVICKIFNNAIATQGRKGQKDPLPKSTADHLLNLYNNNDLTLETEILSLFPKYETSAFLSNLLGSFHANRENYESAIYAYEKFLEINVAYPEIWNNLGIVYLKNKEVKKSFRAFKAAIVQDLKPDYLNGFANALNKLERHDEAIAVYEKILKINPHFGKANYNLGLEAFVKGQYSKAISFFQKDDEIGRSIPKICESLLHLGKIDALEELLNAVKNQMGSDRRLAAISSFVSAQTGRSDIINFANNPLDFVSVSNLCPKIADKEKIFGNLISFCRKQAGHDNPTDKTTINGFQTVGNLFSLNYKSIKLLQSLIVNEVKKYLELYSYENCTFIDDFPVKTSLHGWFVELKKTGFQNSHIHPSGWLSGVIYLKVVESYDDQGAIEFSTHGYGYPLLKNSVPQKLIKPKVGDIVLFPSSTFHRTIPFESDTTRCVIAFDLVPSV